MTTILTPEQITALTPEALGIYYKSLLDDEIAAHQVTQTALESEQANGQEILQQLNAEKEAHAVTVGTAETEISSLSAQLALQTKAAVQGFVSATVGGQQYKVIGSSFKIDGVVVGVADLIKSDELLQKLVAIKSGCLVPIS